MLRKNNDLNERRSKLKCTLAVPTVPPGKF